MKTNRLLALLVLLSLAWVVAGCSGGSSGSFSGGGGGGTSSSAVTLSMTDAPPSNVAILSFEVNVASAVLQSNTGKPDFNIPIPTAIKVEVKHLETETAFLTTATVPADTYKALVLTLTNAEFTFKNNDPTQTIRNCRPGQVCEIQNLPPANVTVTFPTPITIAANSPGGLIVDLRLDNIFDNLLNVSFSAPNGVTVSQVTAQNGELKEQEIEDLVGIVATNPLPANNQFVLQTTRQGNVTIQVDNNTVFQDFDQANPACTANNFSCIKAGQSLEVDLRVMAAGGAFLAKKVELEDDAADDELEGVISSVDDATHFKIVVVEELRDVANVAVGNPINVTLQSGSSFRVNTNGLTVPTGLLNAFQNATDTTQLVPGQEVQIRVRNLTAGPPIAVTTDRLRLRMSRFSGKVASPIAASNFNVDNLPSLFASPIQVQSSSQTKFEGVSGVSGLAVGDSVSLRGLLFKNTPNSALIASKVRKR